MVTGFYGLTPNPQISLHILCLHDQVYVCGLFGPWTNLDPLYK